MYIVPMNDARNVFNWLMRNVDLDTAVNCLLTAADEPEWFSVGGQETIEDCAALCDECMHDDDPEEAPLNLDSVPTILHYISSNPSHGELVSQAVDALCCEWSKISDEHRTACIPVLRSVLALTASQGVDH